ncbi:MAG: glycosyltransferase [Cyanobacteria bacterium P01_D01_bin.44]
MTQADLAPDTVQKFKVNVVTGQGGGGHYAAYRALKAVSEQGNLPWEFQVTDMDDIITDLTQQNEIQNAYEMFGISGHDLYNLMLKSGWTWLWPLKMRLNKFMVKLNYEVGCNFFEQHWRKQQPDLVISFMPLYNRGLAESLQKAKPGTPYVTALVDFADYPPAFWLEPEADSYTVCGTQKALEQARELGLKADRIIPSSGMVVHPKFYNCPPLDIAAERIRLRLDPHRLTGVVMFGGNGSKAMLTVAQRLERFRDLQLIFLCGRNEELAEALKQQPSRQRRFVTTFTEEIPYYMQLSDFFIGKPGPGSLSEALVMDLPVITECGAATLIHERYNAEWVTEKQVGLVIKNFKQVHRAVEKFLDPDTFARYRANAAAIDNQAIFEVTNLLQQLLTQHASGSFQPKAEAAPATAPSC